MFVFAGRYGFVTDDDAVGDDDEDGNRHNSFRKMKLTENHEIGDRESKNLKTKIKERKKCYHFGALLSGI